MLPLLALSFSSLHEASGQEDVFKDMCLHRWMQDDDTCRRRWSLWLSMHKKEESRRRQQKNSPSEALVIQDRTRPPPILALGVVSARDHDLARLAIRETWLDEEGVAAKFFVASTTKRDSSLDAEIQLFDDVHVMNMTESYYSTVEKVIAIFKWGISTGAHYVARANDDVYLRLRPTMNKLFEFPPSRIYAGLFVHNAKPVRDNGGFKSWAVSRTDYPANVYPTFAQGNAYILSRDLAEIVASTAKTTTLPDDVLIGLIVDAIRPRFVDVPTDYEFEGRWTRCKDSSFWHFNIHYEHMYDLHSTSLDVRIGDGDHLHFDIDRSLTLASIARKLLVDYPGINVQGCSGGGGGDQEECLTTDLEVALSSGRCDRIPERIFCCG